MRTLRFDVHMGSVEWVTCQVPSRKESGGEVEGVGVEAVVEAVGELEGGRRVIGMVIVGESFVDGGDCCCCLRCDELLKGGLNDRIWSMLVVGE